MIITLICIIIAISLFSFIAYVNDGSIFAGVVMGIMVGLLIGVGVTCF